MKKGFLFISFSVAFGVFFWVIANFVFTGDMILKLDRAGIVLGYILACLTVGSTITAILSRNLIKRWIIRLVARHRFEGLGTPFEPIKEKVDTIVIPISRRMQPEWIMRNLKPRMVGLVFTENSREDAEQLKNLAKELNIDLIFSGEDFNRGLSEPYDPARSRDIARSMIETALTRGVSISRLFVDLTGGTVPMSIGLFQAAEEAGVSSIYVVGQVNGKIKDPSEPKHGQPIFISNYTDDVK